MRPALAFIALFAAAGAARGQAPAVGDVDAYRALLDRARAAHSGKRYAECAERYGEAYAVSKDAMLLFNRAVCLFDGGQDGDALRELERFLATRPAPADAAAARRLVAHIRQSQRDRVAQAEALSARRDAHVIAAISLGGVGLAALIAGGATTAHAAALWRDAQDACPGRSDCPDDRGQALSQDAKVVADVATGMWVLGASAAVAALVVGLTAPDVPASPRLAVEPRVGMGGAGVLLTGRW